jgi:hypothetical protein
MRSPCAKFAVGLCVVRQIWSQGRAKNEIWSLGREYRDLVTELPQKLEPATKFARQGPENAAATIQHAPLGANLPEPAV